MSSPQILAFAEFRLDAISGHLYRADIVVPLTPKAFALLQHLAERSGRLISKEHLLEAVWPNVFVGDAVLKGTIREVRKALADDPHTPRFIETAHRRGYRFIAAVEVVDPDVSSAGPVLARRDEATTGAVLPAHPPVAAADAASSPPLHPRVRYAQSGNVNIAYQVVGSGPIDLVFVMGWVSHLEYFWNEPAFARFLTRLSGMARLILFDKRGTGLSDAVPVSQLPTLEQRLDDVRAVMEAVGSQRAVLLGVSEGGPLCSLFAATYPERTEALVMIGSYARRLRDDDYPWGPTREEHDAFCRSLVEQWGGPVGIEERGPSRAGDPVFRDWWASYLRMGASPGAAVALTRMNAAIDIRNVLPSIRVPTLVLHRTGDRCLKVEEGRFLASRIPGATFIEQPGDDHLPFVGDQDSMLDAIETFITRSHVRVATPSVLASVLTIQSDATGPDADHLRRVFEREVAWARGRPVGEADRRQATGYGGRTTGDGPRPAGDEAGDGATLMATFDGPGRAVQCGAAVVAVAARSDIRASAGVHIGECDPTARQGPVVATSRALAAAAAPGEVLVSRTIVDLVPGSGLDFVEAGPVSMPDGRRDVLSLRLAVT